MSRTDDMRRGGNVRGGSGGGAPFVAWGDDYTWLEGEVVGSFATKYGLAVTMKVNGVSDNGVTTQGKDEDGNRVSGSAQVGGEVNVSMSSSALEDKIVATDVGKFFHVAFEGWVEGKSNKYRAFTVIELDGADDGVSAAPSAWDGPEPTDTRDAADYDEMPF